MFFQWISRVFSRRPLGQEGNMLCGPHLPDVTYLEAVTVLLCLGLVLEAFAHTRLMWHVRLSLTGCGYVLICDHSDSSLVFLMPFFSFSFVPRALSFNFSGYNYVYVPHWTDTLTQEPVFYSFGTYQLLSNSELWKMKCGCHISDVPVQHWDG